MINLEMYKKLTALAYMHVYSNPQLKQQIKNDFSNQVLSNICISMGSSIQLITT